MSRIRLTALACCLGLLASPVAFGQGGGGGSSGSGGSGGASGGTSGGATGSTSPGVSQPGTSMLGSGGSSGGGTSGGQTGASSGPSGPNRRAQTEGQLRERGVAPSPEQERQQLRDLNAITRQLTPPGTTVPAPEAER
jgi:hypothetical protein